MGLILAAVKLLALACLLKIPRVIADPTTVPVPETTTTILPNSYANSSLTADILLSSESIENENVYKFCHKEGDCLLACDSGDADYLKYELSQIYIQNLECAACGVSVVIKSGVSFLENRIRSHWEIGNIVLTRFEIDLSGVTAIDSNAFSDFAFRHVEILILINLHIAVLHNGTFNGFSSLRSLKLYSLIAYDFTPGFLSGISATLNYFTIYRPLTSASAMNVDSLTGGIILQAVRMVKIKANLNGTLSPRTFTALVRVEILSLSDCEIEVLAANTFAPIQMTLRKLYLQRNRITTIHPDFMRIFEYNRPFMYFNGNPLHCDCLLNSFQTYMKIKYGDGYTVTCNSPANLKNQLVREVNLCAMSYSTTPAQIIAKTEPITSNSGVIHTQCPSSSAAVDPISIPIHRQSLILNLTKNEIGELIVTETTIIDPSIFLIWFRTNSQNVFLENTNNMSFNCLCLITRMTVIRDLAIDTSYTFCLMNRSSSLLSPLNCGSYYHRSPGRDNTWLSEENEIWVIGGIVIGLLLSVLLGMLVGFLMLRQNPNWMKTNAEEDNVDIRLKPQTSVKSNKYVSGLPDKRLPDSCVVQKLPTISSMETNDYEMSIYQSRFEEVQQQLARAKYMNHAESHYYSERMPYAIAPPLPVLRELELLGEQQTDNLENRDNYYSTLEETNYKRID